MCSTYYILICNILIYYGVFLILLKSLGQRVNQHSAAKGKQYLKSGQIVNQCLWNREIFWNLFSSWQTTYLLLHYMTLIFRQRWHCCILATSFFDKAIEIVKSFLWFLDIISLLFLIVYLFFKHYDELLS